MRIFEIAGNAVLQAVTASRMNFVALQKEAAEELSATSTCITGAECTAHGCCLGDLPLFFGLCIVCYVARSAIARIPEYYATHQPALDFLWERRGGIVEAGTQL